MCKKSVCEDNKHNDIGELSDNELIRFLATSEDDKSKCIALNDNIYHIVRVDYFLKMLRSNKLFLKKVFDWEDPYEAAMLRQKIDVNETIMPFSDKFQNIFGQSWSCRNLECDGLWRVYSDNRRNDVVRIKTTVRSLLQAILRSPQHNVRSRDFAIGKVSYFSQDEVIKRNQFFYPNDLGNAPGYGKTLLFFKREEFLYENEVRLIYIPCDEADIGKEIVEISLKNNILDILDSVMFSPWMCSCKKRVLVDELCEYQGFDERKIVESGLYLPMPFVVKEKPMNPDKMEKFGLSGHN